MKLDDRDEALGAALDRSFGGVGRPTPPEPTSVMRRGTWRRTSVVVASFATVAVFVGAFAFASVQFGREAPVVAGSGTWVTEGSMATEGWELERPEGWITAPFDACGSQLPRGVIVSNVTFEFRDPRGTVPSCNGRIVFAGFPQNGVAIDLEPQSRGLLGFTEPLDTPFPIGPSQLLVTDGIVGGPSMSYDDVVIDGGSTALVRMWVGPEAASEDVALAYEILGSIQVEGMDVWVTESPRSAGAPQVVVSRPQDWFATSGYGVVFDTDEQGVLRVATPGLGPKSRHGGCGELYSSRRLPIPEGEAVLNLSLWTGGGWGGPGPHPEFIERPERFAWADAEVNRVDCGGREMTVAAFWFRDAGRQWVARISMDRSVFLGFTGGILLEVLDRLDLTLASVPSSATPSGSPATEVPVELPPPTQDEYRSELVSDERGYRFWPISAPIESGVVYRCAVPHCGLDWIVDIDGSFWEGRAIIFANDWVAADEIPGGDVGTIELEGGAIRYESSDGTWTQLSRVDGSIVRQGCD